MSSTVVLREIPVGPYTFRARVAGPDDGELVLLLHGFPQTSMEWSDQLRAVAAAGYRAVAPDQRGYSPRARPRGVEHYGIDALVGDVLGIADTLGQNRFHLVAHDWGGIVAWHAAARHPERLESLAIVSVPHPNAWARALADASSDQAARSSYIAALQQEGAGAMLTADRGAGLRAGLEATGLVGHDVDEYVDVLTQEGAIDAALNWYRAYDFHRGGVGEIEVPTLFVWGSDDVAIAREGAEWTGEYVRGPYRFVVFEGAPHWVPETEARRLSRLLVDHVRQSPGLPRPATLAAVDGTHLSPGAHARLQEELGWRSGERRQEISQWIERAREHGDIRENADYDAAKNEQGHNEARIRHIEAMLKNAVIVEGAGDDAVGPGVVVTILMDGDDTPEEYLVGSIEERHEKYEVLSVSSPLGQALLGSEVGAVVTYEIPSRSDGPPRTLSVEVVGIRAL